MRWRHPLGLLLIVSLCFACRAARAQEPTLPTDSSIEDLVKQVDPCIVVITVAGRDGKQQGLGTGFIVSADGLIATNLHVIGEARPITVQMPDGRTHPVTEIHAYDRSLDLALVRIDRQELPTLPLGDSDTLRLGQPVVAFGNPLGLEHSVVSGVVSGRRQIDGLDMIQLAIPLEPGNSGGPLVDRQGNVHGILTRKSLVTANLGFAVEINSLKALLERPNPIPIDTWLAIGAIDEEAWTPVFGARWRQRAGRIVADGLGNGFGGRALCLAKREVPELPYELAVEVHLDDESGAAGLVFGADGADKHFGFYPSNGSLRLSRFDGPDVSQWQVLRQEQSSHYLAGEWNTLRVRLEADKVSCYVNDQLIIEEPLSAPVAGSVGLAKFRETSAQYKNFRLASRIGSAAPDAELVAKLTEQVSGVSAAGPFDAQLLKDLAPTVAVSNAVLLDQAAQLEARAARLRELARAVHHANVLADLEAVFAEEESKIDVWRASLLVARLDVVDLDVAAYQSELDRLANVLGKRLAEGADEPTRLAALHEFFFTTSGFHGSRSDYYNRHNSYVNDVLDDREGLPITLSLVYLELAHRIGLNVVGIGLPGHFVVEHRPGAGDPQLIDVFNAGELLTRDAAEQLVQGTSGQPLRPEHLLAITPRAMIVRMLHNLLGLARATSDAPAMIRYLDAILVVSPDAAQERSERAVTRLQAGDRQGALDDVDWLISHPAEGVDIERLREFRQLIEQQAAQQP